MKNRIPEILFGDVLDGHGSVGLLEKGKDYVSYKKTVNYQLKGPHARVVLREYQSIHIL